MARRRGRGEGNIEQLPSGNWRAVVIAGADPTTGKRTREGKTFPTKGEALEWLRQRQTQPTGAGSPSASVSLADWFEKWNAGRVDVVASRTIRDDVWRFSKHIKPHLGGTLLRKLDTNAVEAWLKVLKDAGHSGAERRANGMILRKVLNAAVKRGLMPRSPMAGLKMPKAIRPEKKALTVEEVRRLLDAVGERYRAMFLLWFDTGVRPGELFALQWSSIDFERGEVFVHRSLDEVSRQFKETKTAKSRRRLAVSAETIAALRILELRGTSPDALVFPSPRTANPWRGSNFLRNVFQPACKRASISGFRPYDVRHTTATLLLQAGVNVKVVSERLGHEDITTTLRHYAHVMPGQQAAAAVEMGKIFNSPREPHDDKPRPTEDAK